MPLNAGTRIGPYEVTAAIGAGGMGEVYRARDTKLRRDVALKVLPELFALEPNRLERFQREAQVLASLNHPNIAAIYGFEEAADVCALVLELVEGRTLADRIAQSALPIDEALPIARQIAEALEAAHEHGIIHRDLKPSNIKLRPDGTVKVLDFGLAKALEGDGAATEVSNSPTLSAAATRAGVILGTAAYMSPEQAKGTAVDRRADTFAFGAVLYEMLTGHRAFRGETAAEILASVLKDEPDWSLLPNGTPDAIRHVLRRCLHKDRNRRLQTATDARIEIEDALTRQTPLPANVGATKPRAAIAWIAAALALVIAAGALIVLYFKAAPADVRETRTELVTPGTAEPAWFALSPDGRQIVFVASGDGPSRLWLRSLAATGSQPLAGTEGALSPFWSPDGRSVGFFADGKLKRIDISGGAPQVLANTTFARGGGTWSADGVILFPVSNAGTLFRIPASGGEAVAVTKLDRQLLHQQPQFLPDGRQFLFYANGATPDTYGIYLGSLESKEVKRLTQADTGGMYVPSGWLLWVRAGTLVAQRLDLSKRELVGDPMTVADQVGINIAHGAFSVSPTGLVAYRGGKAGQHQLTWFDRAGKALGTLGAPDDAGLSGPRISPDGSRVAVQRVLQNNPNIWLLDGTRTTRFTFDRGPDTFPFWSPDGSRIVFNSGRNRRRQIYTKLASGAGNEDLVLELPAETVLITNDWSPDGRFVLYHSRDPKTSRDIWVLPMQGDRKPWAFLETNFDEAAGQFSPDGRWVAYQSNESGRYEIYVRPFSESPSGASNAPAAGQWQISTTGGLFARWRADGKEIYYNAPDGRLMAAAITVTGTALEPGTPVPLFQTRIVGGGTDNNVGRQYDVARDGRFLINTVLEDAAAPITLIQNWKPPAK